MDDFGAFVEVLQQHQHCPASLPAVRTNMVYTHETTGQQCAGRSPSVGCSIYFQAMTNNLIETIMDLYKPSLPIRVCQDCDILTFLLCTTYL
uniref:Wsv324-like protein n=1 Tax=Trachysalambria curvirostris nimavirus TaxID=2984282 RepID=A0A9C7EZ19_9VIRU|nr:MAG: wsv324-like protein [Trachysalambria curvirostris nimavirus]